MNWFGYRLALAIAVIAVIVIGVLVGWRALDRRADQASWNALAEQQASGLVYDPAMVAALPEPARRYFAYTIRPGAPLYTVVEIEMTGEIGFGSRQAPDYRPMQARQILAPPHGVVWMLDAGPISGSDGSMPNASLTRFWLFGLVPIVRASGSDHHRSAFGRVIAEAAFWAPASLLPSELVRWQALDQDSARAVVRYGDLTQAVDIIVDDAGAPTRVVIQRWSNENPDRQFREQPFGGDLSEFEQFGGYRLPTRVEGGNHIGTADYFPFFKANVRAIRFPRDE